MNCQKKRCSSIYEQTLFPTANDKGKEKKNGKSKDEAIYKCKCKCKCKINRVRSLFQPQQQELLKEQKKNIKVKKNKCQKKEQTEQKRERKMDSLQQ